MLPRICAVLIAAILVGGCAAYRDTTKAEMAAMTEHYAQFDLRLAWNYRTVDGATVIDGIAKNVRFQAMYDLEIDVAVLEVNGKKAARAVTLVVPRQLSLDDTAGFTLKLPQAVTPGTRLRFTYRYRGTEGGGFGGGLESGTDWVQSFEAVMPAK